MEVVFLVKSYWVEEKEEQEKRHWGEGGPERVRGEAVMSVRIRWMDGWMNG